MVQCQDFLTIQNTPIYREIISHNKPIHIIGNPPFGRQSKTARSFIRICSGFATTISFILPKSFKKQSFKKTFPPCFHLLFQVDMPDNSFTIDNRPYSVPCIFQIWKRMPYDRLINPIIDPIGFVFCKKDDRPDMDIRRVGVYAGRLVEDNIQDLSAQSHYFLRLTDMDRTRFKKLFHDIHFEHENTVGPRSISKQEIITKLRLLS